MTRELNKIKATFEERIERAEALLVAWQNVTRVTKKDGSNFSALAKNFTGVTITNSESYSIISHKIINVYTRTCKGSFVDDSIKNYDLVRYSKRTVDDSRVINEPCVKKHYYLTIDEIFEEINNKIEYYKNAIASYKKELSEIEDHFNLIMDKMVEIKEIINTIAPKNGDNLTTRYKLTDAIKNYNFY